jgi:hypothetical protein
VTSAPVDEYKSTMLVKMLYDALDDAIGTMEAMLSYVEEYHAARNNFYIDIICAREILAAAEESILS